MQKFSYIISILMIFVLALIIFSPKNTADEQTLAVPKYKVGVVLKAMDSEHWLAVYSSMQKAAQAHNINLIILWADNESAYLEQNQIIRDLLASDIDALIISPSNIYESTAYLNLAKAKNIPLFTLDERLDGIPYIGSDNYAIGVKAAKYMQEHLPSGAFVGIIAGSNFQDAHLQRVQGFTDYINEYTDLNITECLADDTKYRQATIQAEKMLREYPQTQGIFVTSAIMTLGTIEVTDTVKPHIQIVGVDTQNDAIMAIKNGKIDAMISQDGHQTGTLAIETVSNYLKDHSNKPAKTYIDNDLITSDNAANYLLQEDF